LRILPRRKEGKKRRVKTAAAILEGGEAKYFINPTSRVGEKGGRGKFHALDELKSQGSR